MKRLIACSLLLACVVFAEKLPFTAECSYAEVVRVPGGESMTVSDYIELPALPAREGMVAVLHLNIRQIVRNGNGWNPWCMLELNGTILGPQDSRHMPRLLKRGFFLHTSYKGESKVPYWSSSSNASFMTFFTADETENLDKRILDREDGYNFYFNVDDLAHKVIIGADDRVEANTPNRLRFMNALTKRILDATLVVKDIELGYVPAGIINEASGINYRTFKHVEKPVQTLVSEDSKLLIAKDGGMELVIGNESFFIESAFSYEAEPEMKYYHLGIEQYPENAANKDNPGQVHVDIKRLKKDKVEIFMVAPTLAVRRVIMSCFGRFQILDEIMNRAGKERGLKWHNDFAVSGRLPETWRISGMSGSLGSDSSCAAAANPTLYMRGKEAGICMVAEDTVSRVLLDMEASGNVLRMGTKGVGIPSGNMLSAKWWIYTRKALACDYFDFINWIRINWDVNKTIPGPYMIRAVKQDGLRLGFASISPWFEYGDGLKYTRDEYVKFCSDKLTKLRTQFPGAKFMAMLETNLVRFDASTVPWGNELPLTYGDRSNPATAYAQFLKPEVSRKLDAVIDLKDSVLRDKDGNIMIDTNYVYEKKPWINLMPQPEKGNTRFRQMLEQVDFVMNNLDIDGVYIDQFNPSLKDGVSYDRWDGYSVVLDKTGKIISKSYNYAIMGATARMEIVRRVTDKGGVVLTNGHPVTKEEQKQRYSFAEMENDRCNPLPFLDKQPPEFRYQATGHLATPIILNLRPSRYTQDPRMKARVLFKGLIIALRNGVLPYYYSTDIETSGPNAGGLSVANWLFPFTPRRLGEGVLVGRERTIVCKSGTYTIDSGNHPPTLVHFNNMGLEVKDSKAFSVAGGPCNWQVTVKLDDWNEIAVMEVK